MFSAELPNKLAFHPLTVDRWADLETLFGSHGACDGCWCMWWRVPRSVFAQQKGEGNRQALHRLVEAGTALGILAYVEEKPLAWCAVAPRESYPGLARSRILKPVDAEPVWSIVCLFVARPWRRRGLTVSLLRAATAFARANGAAIVEGYPIDTRAKSRPAAFLYTGIASAFAKAGFVEVARRSPTRPIMRYPSSDG